MQNTLISIRPSKFEELAIFSEMEKQTHAIKFVNSTPLATHERNFVDQSIVYLSIENASTGLVGYFILRVGEDQNNIEFRRVLVDENQRGVGQAAIKQMEQYCKSTLGAKRIWLDVYADNEKGKHIYQKLGYRQFKTQGYGSRMLYFYEKRL